MKKLIAAIAITIVITGSNVSATTSYSTPDATHAQIILPGGESSYDEEVAQAYEDAGRRQTEERDTVDND